MDITKTWIPYISGENFRLGALNIPNIATKEYFRNIKTPANIFPSINLHTNAMLYVFVQENQIPHKSTLLTSCGTFEDVYGNSSDSGFYFPRIIEIE